MLTAMRVLVIMFLGLVVLLGSGCERRPDGPPLTANEVRTLEWLTRDPYVRVTHKWRDDLGVLNVRTTQGATEALYQIRTDNRGKTTLHRELSGGVLDTVAVP